MEPRTPKPRWSMYPKLHDEVSRILVLDKLHFTFHNEDTEAHVRKDWDTNIMGRFTCRNRACASFGWSSKKIAIRIRLYSNDEYNAKVYHQSCSTCNRMSKPRLDFSYADRVAYRLKKWKGFDLEPPPYKKGSKGPHLWKLCEGCKDGHCSHLDDH